MTIKRDNGAPAATDVKVFVPTKDFEHSIDFYQALGWAVNWRDVGLAEVELAGVRLLLQDFYAKDWAENFMVYVVVEDAAAWHARIQQVLAGGAFPTARVKPPETQPYGATVTFATDPSGVLLHFSQLPASEERPDS